MIQTKTMYGVEHACSDGGQTYDIFPSLQEAEVFATTDGFWDSEHVPLHIFKADFNMDRIFMEDGGWNYDDASDTIIEDYGIIKEINQYPSDFTA